MPAPLSFHVLRFDRAASRYENEAGVQARMADHLLDLWSWSREPARILELGCGTGLLTRKLRTRLPPTTSILATDAAPHMLAEAQKQSFGEAIRFELCDAEGIVEPPKIIHQGAPFNLLASNALAQWFSDLPRHLRFAADLSAADGFYLLSGFARDNFPELNALLSEPPFSYRSFPGHNPDAVHAAAETTGWRIHALQSWEEKEILPSPLAALRRIQSLGSSRDPREGGRLNRKNLSWLVSEYERRFKTEDGVTLTWRPWVACLALNPSPLTPLPR